MNPAQNILKDLLAELKTIARTETIVGAPITAGEYTLVPVSRVSIGVGAGGGAGEMEKKSQTGEGGGGGGGIRISPVAILAVRGGDLTVHMLGAGATLGHTVEKLPESLGKSLEHLLDSWLSRKAKGEKESS